MGGDLSKNATKCLGDPSANLDNLGKDFHTSWTLVLTLQVSLVDREQLSNGI